MTDGDREFMKGMGIEPCDLHDPLTDRHTPRRCSAPAIPSLPGRDARRLLDLRIRCEREPEPDFVLPHTLSEYLTRYPNGIREAVEASAKEMGISLSAEVLGNLARDIIAMFLDFVALDLEDIVEMYPFHRSLCRGAKEPMSAHFHGYITLRIRAAVETLVERDPSRYGKC